MDKRRHVVLGQINGLYGVLGGLKVFSYTRPRTNLFSYNLWLVGKQGRWHEHELIEGKARGKGLVAYLTGIADRDAASALIGSDIAVYREQLPELPEGKYYWHDLIQLEVINHEGISLGKVIEILETGANDVLVVQGENKMLIPLVVGEIVSSVDFQAGEIRVIWYPDYI